MTLRFYQERFETASKDAANPEGSLKGISTSNDDKLKMYALFKQVIIFGPCLERIANAKHRGS